MRHPIKTGTFCGIARENSVMGTGLWADIGTVMCTARQNNDSYFHFIPIVIAHWE